MTVPAPRPDVAAIAAYDEEAAPGLNLANNANVFPPNPALAKTLAALTPEALWDYPSLTSEPLRVALGRHLDVDPSWVLTGNGSNDLVDILIRTYVPDGGRVAYHPPSFGMIPIFARAAGAHVVEVPLDEAWAYDVDGLAAADADITFVVTPNNPTGNTLPLADVERIVAAARGVVVVDEAYGEFGGESLIPRLRDHPNAVVLKTFSKAYGLAGLRVGYVVAHPDVVTEMGKVRGPFRLNAVSERGARQALDEGAWLANVVETVAFERVRLQRELDARGFTAYPSQANFVLARAPPDVDATRLQAALGKRQVRIRRFGGALSGHVRVTVGPPDVVDRFLAALDEALPEARS